MKATSATRPMLVCLRRWSSLWRSSRSRPPCACGCECAWPWGCASPWECSCSCGSGCGCEWLLCSTLSPPLRQQPQQLRVGRQDDAGLVVEDLPVGIERADELVELGTARVRLAVDPGRLGIPFPLDLLRLAIRARQQHLALLVGLGADLHRGFFALGPVLLRNPLALRPHASEHRFLVLLWKGEALELYVDELDAELAACDRARRAGDLLHDARRLHRLRLVRNEVRELYLAHLGREGGPDDVVQPHL